MSRLSVEILPARRRNHALSLAPATVSSLDFAVRPGQTGLQRAPDAPGRGLPTKLSALADHDHADRGTALPADAWSRMTARPGTARLTSDARSLHGDALLLTATPERDRSVRKSTRTKPRQDAQSVLQPGSLPPDRAGTDRAAAACSTGSHRGPMPSRLVPSDRAAGLLPPDRACLGPCRRIRVRPHAAEPWHHARIHQTARTSRHQTG